MNIIYNQDSKLAQNFLYRQAKLGNTITPKESAAVYHLTAGLSRIAAMTSESITGLFRGVYPIVGGSANSVTLNLATFSELTGYVNRNDTQDIIWGYSGSYSGYNPSFPPTVTSNYVQGSDHGSETSSGYYGVIHGLTSTKNNFSAAIYLQNKTSESLTSDEFWFADGPTNYYYEGGYVFGYHGYSSPNSVEMAYTANKRQESSLMRSISFNCGNIQNPLGVPPFKDNSISFLNYAVGGFYGLCRASNDTFKAWFGQSKEIDSYGAVADFASPTSLYFLSTSVGAGASTPCRAKVSFFCFGNALTDTQMDELRDTVETFNEMLGRKIDNCSCFYETEDSGLKPAVVALGTPNISGIPYTMPKVTPGDGSLILQVSPNGTTWYDAITNMYSNQSGTFDKSPLASAAIEYKPSGGTAMGYYGSGYYFRAKNTLGEQSSNSTQATSVTTVPDSGIVPNYATGSVDSNGTGVYLSFGSLAKNATQHYFIDYKVNNGNWTIYPEGRLINNNAYYAYDGFGGRFTVGDVLSFRAKDRNTYQAGPHSLIGTYQLPNVDSFLYFKSFNGTSTTWSEVNNWWLHPAGTGAHPTGAPWTGDTAYKTWSVKLVSGQSVYPSIDTNVVIGSPTQVWQVAGTSFIPYVDNYSDIRGAIWNGINFRNHLPNGRILGGAFYGDDFLNEGEVNANPSFFGSGFQNEGTINNGTFSGADFSNNTNGLIGGGTFYNSGFYNDGQIYGSAIWSGKSYSLGSNGSNTAVGWP